MGFVETIRIRIGCWLLPALGFAALLASAPAPGADFGRSIAGRIGSNVAVTATAVDRFANTVVTGWFDGPSLTLGSTTLTRLGTRDVFVAQYDSSGTLVWAKSLGGSGATATSTAIVIDSFANPIVTGTYVGDLTSPVLARANATSVTDAFVIKLDNSNGSLRWAKSYGGAGATTTATSIAIDSADSTFIGGSFTGGSIKSPSESSAALVVNGSVNPFFVKVSSTGAEQWSTSHGGANVTGGVNALAVDGSDNLLATGYFRFGDLDTVPLSRAGTGLSTFLLRLAGADGFVSMARSFGGNAETEAKGIAADGSGNIYLAGRTLGAAMTQPAYSLAGSQDAILIKVDSGGTATVHKGIGNGGAIVEFNSVVLETNGGIVLGGILSSGDLNTPAMTRRGVQDAFALRLPADASTITWSTNFGGERATTDGFVAGRQSTLYLGGYVKDGDLGGPLVLQRQGIQDGFAAKLDSSNSGQVTWSLDAGYSVAGGTVLVNATAIDASGNVYVAGALAADLARTGTLQAGRLGTNDLLVARFDSAGTALWLKAFGGPGADTRAKGIAVSGNQVYVIGSMAGGNLTAPNVNLTGNSDTLLLKLGAADGSTTWATNFGGAGAVATPSGIGIDTTGNPVLAGIYDQPLTNPSLPLTGATDVFAIKVNVNGGLVWSTHHGGAGTIATAGTLAVDVQDNAYFAGSFRNGNIETTTPNLTRIGTSDAMAISLNGGTGAVRWSQNFGGAGAFTTGQAIAVDTSSASYVTGTFTLADLTSPPLARAGATDAFALKMNSSGTSVSWQQNFGGAGVSVASPRVAFRTGYAYAGGWFTGGALTTPSVAQIGTRTGYAIQLGFASGSINSSKGFGGAGALATFESLTVDEQGNAYVTGEFSGANLTTPALALSGTTDGFVMRQAVGNVPGAPTVTGVARGNAQVTVTFTGPSSDGGNPIVSYAATCGSQTVGGAASPIVVTGLVNGTAYTCTATAINGVGSSAASSPSSSVTPATKPSAPTIGTAMRGASGQVVVAFTVPSANGDPITGYTATCGAQSAPGNGSPITVGNLANGTPVTCTVTATNGLGTSDPSSASNSVTPATLPGAPTIGTATKGGAGQIVVAFTAPASNGGDAILNYTATCGSTSVPGPASPITVGGLVAGPSYTCTVTATNGVGTGPASGASNSVLLATAPGAPGVGVAIAGNAQATVTFTAPASDGGSPVTGYTVVSSPAGGTDSNGGSTGLSHVVTGLANGTAYTFTVTATNVVGPGPASSASNSVTPSATQRTLTVTKNGSGTGTVSSNDAQIACGATCSKAFASGNAVQLTATPDAGSQFIGWLGACTGTGTCPVPMTADAAVSATFAPTSVQLRADVDGNNSYDALTDGLIVLRYLFGLTGSALTSNAIGTGATLTTPAQVLANLGDIRPLLDIDGNGQVDALTDGLMMIRYLFGLRGAPLIANAIGSGAIRTTSTQVEAYIAAILP